MIKKFFLYVLLFFIVDCKGDANLISSVSTTPNKIVIMPSQEFKERFGVPDFYVEYEDDTLDLTGLPYSIVTLPFVMHALPMIWLSGDTYYIDYLDADFNKSMQIIQRVISIFYPAMSWTGKLIARNLVKYSFTESPEHSKNKYGIVSPFSGGVDSMYNTLACMGKKQQLVTLWGGDVPIRSVGVWRKIKEACKELSSIWGCDHACVKSNFRDLYGYDENLNPLGLWTMAGQSLSYSGLVAPLTIAKGYPFILIGSAVTVDLPLPYGSHPFIDHAIAFAGVNVIHFGGECNRSDKIRYIIQSCKKYNKPKPLLRVCWKKDLQGQNCCKCINKCLPTIHGLLAEGENPKEYGFVNWSPKRVIELTRNIFDDKKGMSMDRASIWGIIQERIKEQLDRGMQFPSPIQEHFLWLVQQDFQKCFKS